MRANYKPTETQTKKIKNSNLIVLEFNFKSPEIKLSTRTLPKLKTYTQYVFKRVGKNQWELFLFDAFASDKREYANRINLTK